MQLPLGILRHVYRESEGWQTKGETLWNGVLPLIPT